MLIIMWEVNVFETVKRNYSEGIKACTNSVNNGEAKKYEAKCKVNRQFSALSRLMKLFDLHVIHFKAVSIGSNAPFHSAL